MKGEFGEIGGSNYPTARGVDILTGPVGIEEYMRENTWRYFAVRRVLVYQYIHAGEYMRILGGLTIVQLSESLSG